MKNKRHQPNNPTETRTIQSRTQIAKLHSELGSNDSTGYRIPILSQARGSQNAPPQRIPRVDEVESRGWGRRAPQSPSSSSFGAPQGNNEIYTYDVVFSPGEARINNQSPTPIPYKITKNISRLQVIPPYNTALFYKLHTSLLPKNTCNPRIFPVYYN